MSTISKVENNVINENEEMLTLLINADTNTLECYLRTGPCN